MPDASGTPNLAVFCDYENVAIGVRDAHYERFDIALVLERILAKGKVVVKKAYADWERYKAVKREMHEAAFEMIEIPHVSLSGKNSADIRLVVDALDLCHTKSHVDGFVIVSGDSDFSPLVSKLRENNKLVIGLGVKNSSSDLLIENCDEFIYYDDLVRGRKQQARTRPRPEAGKKTTIKESGPGQAASKPSARPTEKSSAEKTGDKQEALDLVVDTVASLFTDSDANVWGSMVKQALKRKRPTFAESYYGYRTFNQLLEDARDKKLLDIRKDEKSGGYVILGFDPRLG